MTKEADNVESGTWLGAASCAVAISVFAIFLAASNLKIEPTIGDGLGFGASLTSPGSPVLFAGLGAGFVAGAALAVVGLRRQRDGWNGLCVVGLGLNALFALFIGIFLYTGVSQQP